MEQAYKYPQRPLSLTCKPFLASHKAVTSRETDFKRRKLFFSLLNCELVFICTVESVCLTNSCGRKKIRKTTKIQCRTQIPAKLQQEMRFVYGESLFAAANTPGFLLKGIIQIMQKWWVSHLQLLKSSRPQTRRPICPLASAAPAILWFTVNYKWSAYIKVCWTYVDVKNSVISCRCV